MKKYYLLSLLVLTLSLDSFAQETYATQIENFNANFTERNTTPPFSGTFNNGSLEIGQFANGGNFGNTPGAAVFRDFTTNGADETSIGRNLQIGDEFTITVFTTGNSSIGGRIGIAFRSSRTYTDFFSSTDNNTVARFQLDNSGGWKIYTGGQSGGVLQNENTNATPGSDRTLTIKITSANTFNATIDGTAYQDISFGNSGPIQSFSIYTYGDSNPNSFWKNASLTATGEIAIGGSNTNFEVSEIITDGLTANSNSTTQVNDLAKNGTGNVTLSGNNSYTGTTTLNAGILTIGDGGSTGTLGTGNVTNNANLTFNRSDNINVSNIIFGTGSLSKLGSNTLTLSGNNTYSGNTTIASGILTLDTGGNLSDATEVTISNGATFDLNNQNITVRSVAETGTSNGGAINLGSGTLTIAGDYAGERFQNTISGTGGLIKNGAATWTLYGNNSYTGNTIINGGVLKINNVIGLGTIDGSVTVNTGAALELNAEANYPAQAITLNGTGISDGGALRKTAIGTQQYPGAITLNNDSRINVTGGTLDYRGEMNLTGNTAYFGGNLNFMFGSGSTSINATKIDGDGALFKDGTGTLWIRPDANFTGNLTLVNGEIRQYTGSFPSDGKVIIRGGTYRSDGTSNRTIAKSVDVEGDFTLGHLAGGSIIIEGDVDLTAGNRIVTMLNNNTITGVVFNGQLTKSGTGVLSLSNALNIFSGGLNILEGTVSVSNNDALGSGILTLGNGSTPTILDITESMSRSSDITVTDGSTRSSINIASEKTLTFTGSFATGTNNSTKLGKSGPGTLIASGASTYAGQMQIGNGTVIVSNNTAIGVNYTTVARGIDLGLNVGDISQGNNVSLLATDGIVFPQSIYVAPNTASATRTIGLSGSGSTTFDNEIFLDGTLTVNAGEGTVTLSGNLISTGGININGGTVNLTGQNTYSGATVITSGTLKLQGDLTNSDVTVQSGSTLEIDGDITVKSLTVNQGGLVIIDEGKSLTITGNLNNSGTFNLNSSSESYSSLIVNGTSTGDVTYNRFTNAIGSGTSGGNDLVAAPLSGQSVADFVNANSNLAQNVDNTQVAFAIFNNTIGSYVNYSPNSSATLSAGTGYRAATIGGAPLAYTGIVETGSPSVTITAAASVWNLIGNPYPSYISSTDFLSAANTSLLDPEATAIYGYNDGTYSGTTGNTVGNFTIINNNINSGLNIAPGQGFFVASNAVGGDIEFTPEMRTTDGSDDFILGRSPAPNYYLLLELNSNAVYNTSFYFNENSTLGLDPGYDAAVFGNSSTNYPIYSHLVEDNTGRPMAMQSLNDTDISNVTIPLGVNSNTGEQITFSIAESTLPNTVNVYLEDTATNTFTLLNTGDYTMTPNNALNGVGRFFLRFGVNALSSADTTLDNLAIYANKTNKTIVIAGQLLQRTTVYVYDLQGRLVLSHALDGKLQVNEVDVNSLGQGVYIVELRGNTQNRTTKIILN